MWVDGRLTSEGSDDFKYTLSIILIIIIYRIIISNITLKKETLSDSLERVKNAQLSIILKLPLIMYM